MRNKILNLLKDKGGLPPLPRILFNLERMVKDPDCDIETVAALVETEPVLCGKLIKIANSAYFGRALDRSKDIPVVILRLGLQTILDLSYTLELPKMFDQLKGFDQIRFWKHSMAVGFLAQSLALHLGLDKDKQKEIYLAGLIHDIGILVFFYLIPEEYRELSKNFKDSDQSPHQLEQEKFGIEHSELGARYLKLHWQVSQTIVKGIGDHHHSVSKGNLRIDRAGIVSIADTLVEIYGVDHEFTTSQKLPSHNEFLNVLDLTLDKLEFLIEESRQQVEDAEKALMG